MYLVLQITDSWTTRVARLGKKAPTGLLLTSAGTIKSSTGALLLFGLLFETSVATLGYFRLIQNHSISIRLIKV